MLPLSSPAPYEDQRDTHPLLDAAVSRRLPAKRYDVVIVGAGVAGLTFALGLPGRLRIALLSKGEIGESNTRWAQGGLSAAIGQDDSAELHVADTIAAGAGLCDESAVRDLAGGAAGAVEWLLSIGTRFDRDDVSGEILLGREAAHSRHRVLHAGGDATGAEIERALVHAVHQRSRIELFPRAFAVDLVVDGDRATGLVALLPEPGRLVRLDAEIVAIAAGGAGQLWATTSNPKAATADGFAMALRAGIAVADAEFVQFHPTVLTLPDGTPFLVSEAVRGEGAYLRGRDGVRFMQDLHPMAELAPRDVVARGIQRQMAADRSDHVNLDLRHLDGPAMRRRFPTIAGELTRRGLDLTTSLIPVAPAAHYFMGGIVARSDGITSLSGLVALGEAACTGVHGANRLASNSLLEGLVFGLNAAVSAGTRATNVEATADWKLGTSPRPTASPENLTKLRSRVQYAMSRDVAVVRDATGLAHAAAEIDLVLEALHEGQGHDRDFWETANIATVARTIVRAATLREESRGAHFRVDFPHRDPGLDGSHLVRGGGEGADWGYTSLDAVRQPNDRS